MATRNPTSFVVYPDQSLIKPRKIITAPPIDDVVDNQQFVLDSADLVLSVSFPALQITTVTASWETVGRWYFDCTDHSSQSTELLCEFYVYAWMENGSNGGSVKITTGASGSPSTDTIAISATTTPAWYKTSAGIYCRSSGVEENLLVEANCANAATDLFITAFGLFAPET